MKPSVNIEIPQKINHTKFHESYWKEETQSAEGERQVSQHVKTRVTIAKGRKIFMNHDVNKNITCTLSQESKKQLSSKTANHDHQSHRSPESERCLSKAPSCGTEGCYSS